jgi:hypothetical protein
MVASPEVDAWFAALEHPLNETMQSVRAAILSADPRVDESIKWKSPTFAYKGNIASINPQARKHVSLMFHRGAEIPGEYPSLEGGGEVARYMRFLDPADVDAKSAELRAIIQAWCDAKDS